MADKEATVYVVDVGRSMGRKHQSREETDLDWAMRYVWDKITTTVCEVSSQRKDRALISLDSYRAENFADRGLGSKD